MKSLLEASFRMDRELVALGLTRASIEQVDIMSDDKKSGIAYVYCRGGQELMINFKCDGWYDEERIRQVFMPSLSRIH